MSNSSDRLSFFSLQIQMFEDDLHISCLLFIFRFKILCQYLLRTIFSRWKSNPIWMRSLKPTPKDFRNENFTFHQHKHNHTHTLTIGELKKIQQTIDDTHYTLYLNNNALDTNDQKNSEKNALNRSEKPRNTEVKRERVEYFSNNNKNVEHHFKSTAYDELAFKHRTLGFLPTHITALGRGSTCHWGKCAILYADTHATSRIESTPL